jgi:hypothetical protein
MTKSLLYQGQIGMTVPPGCLLGDRTEIPVSLRKNGRIYRFVLRDKLVVEDIMLVLMKAAAFAISQGEPYAGTPPSRALRDVLLKQDTVM